MPRTAIDYSKSCIYKICCKDPSIEDIYVGSTTEIAKRRCVHKNTCNNPNVKGHSRQVYQFIRENGGWDNWDLVRIESFPCDSYEAMLQRERELFDELKPTLNSNRPKISKEERLEVVRAQAKAWREAYPDKHRAASKAWADANRERVRANNKEWREANPEKEVERKKAWDAKRVICERCGKEVARGHLKTHQKSKKCVAAQSASNIAPLEDPPIQIVNC
jgi:RNA polymerase-binding transcription factor DksA